MTLRRIAANSAWLLLDKVVRIGGNLALTIWMARSVGPQAFGAFGFATAVAGIVAAVGTLGLQSVVMRDMVSEPSTDRTALLSAAFRLRLIVSIAIVAGSSAGVILLRHGIDTAAILTMILASAALPQTLDVLEWALLSDERARLVAIFRTGAFAVFAVLRVVIIAANGSLVLFALSILAEAACASIVLIVVARGLGIRMALTSGGSIYITRYVRAAAPLVTAALCVQIYMRADQLLIAELLGLREAGLYAAAVRISEAWNFFPAAVMMALYPRLTSAFKRSEQEFRLMLSRTILALTATAFVFAIVVWAVSDRFILVLYGVDFAAAAPVLAIHVFSSVLITVGVASGPYLVNHGLFRIAMMQTLAAGALSIGLNLALIPRWGLVGAAYATLASQSLSVLLLNVLHPLTRPLLLLQTTAILKPWSLR